MGEHVRVPPDDYWADDLRTVGARLGKFRLYVSWTRVLGTTRTDRGIGQL